MSNMTYRDIPVLRAAGFETAWSGFAWFRVGNDGQTWYADEDDDTGLLRFEPDRGVAINMTREEFSKMFEKVEAETDG